MLLKRFNVEREAEGQADIARLIAEGYEPVEEVEDEAEEVEDLFSMTVKKTSGIWQKREGSAERRP